MRLGPLPLCPCYQNFRRPSSRQNKTLDSLKNIIIALHLVVKRWPFFAVNQIKNLTRTEILSGHFVWNFLPEKGQGKLKNRIYVA